MAAGASITCFSDLAEFFESADTEGDDRRDDGLFGNSQTPAYHAIGAASNRTATVAVPHALVAIL